MFRTNTEIREAARAKVREEGRREENERIRSELEARGVELPPDIVNDLFDRKNGKET